MDLNLKDKTAFVTGGSKGIGLAIKEALEIEGVNVTSLSRSEGYDLMSNGFPEAHKLARESDILINNLGGMGTCRPEDYMECMKKNYGISIRLIEGFLSRKRDYGRIITISSIYGKEAGHNPGFTATKAAQIAMMKSYSRKYRKTTFNTICPGHIDTGKPFPDDPKIIGQPQDVANLVLFLCSNKAKHINGACITVDGGESISF